MKPIAAPIIGGMVTSMIHVLIITPVIFYLKKTRVASRHTACLRDASVKSSANASEGALMGIRLAAPSVIDRKSVV